MIVSSLKKYVMDKKSVTLSQILLDLDTTLDEIKGPLDLLIQKNYIKKEELPSGSDCSTSKCKACPMTCPTTSGTVTVYNWNKY